MLQVEQELWLALGISRVMVFKHLGLMLVYVR